MIKNYIYYLGMLILTTIILFFIYIYMICLDVFVKHIFIYLGFYILTLIISSFILHYIKTIFFIIICKFKKQRYAVVCLYPFVWIRGKLIILFGPSNYVFYKNLCDVNDISLHCMDEKYSLIEKINIQVNIYILLLSLILFVIGICQKIYLLILPCFSYVLYKITIDFLNSFNGNNKKYFFNELLFTNIINNELIHWHIGYLKENGVNIFNNPNEILNCLKLMFILNKHGLNESLCELDSVVKQMVLKHGKTMRIECLDLIFDYVDLRICLNSANNKINLVELLEVFCEIDNWDFQIIDLYNDRIEILKNHINNGSQIQIRRKLYRNIYNQIPSRKEEIYENK